MRPLRVREIEDGIAFRDDCAKPTMENGICRNIFDLCGPLIEELPDGCVDTVHFSAKESVTLETRPSSANPCLDTFFIDTVDLSLIAPWPIEA